jgi:uncharacterized protein
MITSAMIPGVEINLYLLVFLSVAAGVISGFVGIGGGFIMTPALVIMGFPAQFAVGTGMMWVLGNSIIGTLRHRRLGNVDFKLGMIMIVFMMCGVEIGIRSLRAAINAGMADTAVLVVTICALCLVGGFVFWESTTSKANFDKMIKERVNIPTNCNTGFLVSLCSRITVPPVISCPKSDVRVSLWILAVIGLVTGTLSGFIGVGGGFIIVPALVYLLGVPSFIAVGTSLFQIGFPAAFGAVRYTMDGNVIIFITFIMILGSSIGILFGAQLTKYLRDFAVKYILSSTMLVSVLGSILKILSITTGSESDWLNNGMTVVTFGGLAIILCLISGLFIIAMRNKRGKHIPAWTQAFVKY